MPLEDSTNISSGGSQEILNLIAKAGNAAEELNSIDSKNFQKHHSIFTALFDRKVLKAEVESKENLKNLLEFLNGLEQKLQNPSLTDPEKELLITEWKAIKANLDEVHNKFKGKKVMALAKHEIYGTTNVSFASLIKRIDRSSPQEILNLVAKAGNAAEKLNFIDSKDFQRHRSIFTALFDRKVLKEELKSKEDIKTLLDFLNGLEQKLQNPTLTDPEKKLLVTKWKAIEAKLDSVRHKFKGKKVMALAKHEIYGTTNVSFAGLIKRIDRTCTKLESSQRIKNTISEIEKMIATENWEQFFLAEQIDVKDLNEFLKENPNLSSIQNEKFHTFLARNPTSPNFLQQLIRAKLKINPWSQNILGTAGHRYSEKLAVLQMIYRLSSEFDAWLGTDSPEADKWKEIKKEINDARNNILHERHSDSELNQLTKKRDFIKNYSEFFIKKNKNQAFNEREKLSYIISLLKDDLSDENKKLLKITLSKEENYKREKDGLSEVDKILIETEGYLNAQIALRQHSLDEDLANKVDLANREILNQWTYLLNDLRNEKPSVKTIGTSLWHKIRGLRRKELFSSTGGELFSDAVNALSELNAVLRKDIPPWRERMMAAGFKCKKELGKGTATVEKWSRTIPDRLVETVAVKIVEKTLLNQEELFIDWITKLKGERTARVEHPGLMRVVGAFTSRNNKGTGIVDAYIMEYIEGVELNQRLSDKTTPLTRKDKDEIAINFLTALNALHERGIIHGDIKLQNVMFLEGNKVKIIDPGLHSQLTKLIKTVNVPEGTALYMAPELAQAQLKRRKVPYDQKVDVYAVGVLLLRLYSESPAFNTESQFWHESLSSSASLVKRETEKIQDSNLKQLILSMLANDPNQRPTIKEVIDRLHVGHF